METRHFYPDDQDAFAKLHLAALSNREGGVQLRLDAIDALETHYTPRVHGGFTHHQPLELAYAAGAKLLELLGFTSVVRDKETVTSATPDQAAGWILTASPTSTAGRCRWCSPARRPRRTCRRCLSPPRCCTRA